MRTAPGLLALAVLLALAGCVPTGGETAGPPTPSATPVFASDADALAAAEKAYAAYQAVSDQILIDGGNAPTRLLDVATRNVYEVEATGYSMALQRKLHGVGESSFDNVSLQSYHPSDPANTVSVYLCVDVSKLDVVDSAGVSVVSATRPSRTAFQVSFELLRTDRNRLVVSDRQVWDGGGIC